MPTLSAPTIPVFWISVVLAVLALLGHFAKIPFITEYQFWVAIVGLCGPVLGQYPQGHVAFVTRLRSARNPRPRASPREFR